MSLHLPVCLWSVASELGEGPIWQARERAVYFVDIKGRKVHRCSENGMQRRSWHVPQQPGFIVPINDGSFVCGLQDGLYRFNSDTGQFSLMQGVERHVPDNRLNDGFVDHRGCLWFGSMHDGESQSSGALYRMDCAGDVQVRDRNYVITNGPAMSPDGSTLYHADTLQGIVYAFDVDIGGRLSHKRQFVKIEGTGYPDGMAVDADGFLWVAIFGGGRIERFSSHGKRVDMITFPCANVTKLTFGGADLCTVYVTTAWKGLSPEERALQPLAGNLFSFRTNTPGLPQNQYTIGTSE